MRFTIRDIVWLTVVVGLVIALSMNHLRHESEYKRLVRKYDYIVDVANLVIETQADGEVRIWTTAETLPNGLLQSHKPDPSPSVVRP